jgi:hypothetical protein
MYCEVGSAGFGGGRIVLVAYKYVPGSTILGDELELVRQVLVGVSIHVDVDLVVHEVR